MAITDPDSDQRVPLDHDLSLLYSKEVSAWNAAECEHSDKELRRGFNKGGGPIVQLQCLACGKQIGKFEKRTPETDLLNEIDEVLYPQYQAKRNLELDGIRRKYVALQTGRWKGSEEGRSYFQRSHSEYLSSPEWAERRSLTMDRASGLCEGCRKAKATEVHHLSYRNWGAEFLFELVALCGSCHDRVHRLDDERATGCTDCIHVSDGGEWCQQFAMPTAAALLPNGACGPDREGFLARDEFE